MAGWDQRLERRGGLKDAGDGAASATNGINLRQRVETEAQLTMGSSSESQRARDKERDMERKGRKAHTQVVDLLALMAEWRSVIGCE